MRKYTEQEEEEIKARYKLSAEKHNQIFEDIKRIWLTDPIPVEHPQAIIIGGQTGAGKTGMIGYSRNQFEDGNVVIINSDDLKPFHPQSSEIARLYPELYTKVTDQESNTWTSDLFETTMQEGYNLIFEGTMKNTRILGSIQKLKSLGYEVTVRGLAVSDLESMLSILERYNAQVSVKGWGRLVVPNHHYETYNGMPETIQAIEESNLADHIEILKRGPRPTEPKIIYSERDRMGYSNAKRAVLKGREEDTLRILADFEARARAINEAMVKRKASPEEQQILLDLLEHFYQVREQCSKKKPEKEPEEGYAIGED